MRSHVKKSLSPILMMERRAKARKRQRRLERKRRERVSRVACSLAALSPAGTNVLPRLYVFFRTAGAKARSGT